MMPLVCADLLPPRQVLDVPAGPAARQEQGFAGGGSLPAAERRRCVPFPRGGSGTPARAGMCSGQGCEHCPRGFLEPTGGTVCVQVMGYPGPAYAFAQ